jgi:hypothetical protein
MVHGPDNLAFRDLPTYSDRVKAFNAACIKLREYVRVMMELDSTPERPSDQIVENRIETIKKEINAINSLLH